MTTNTFAIRRELNNLIDRKYYTAKISKIIYYLSMIFSAIISMMLVASNLIDVTPITLGELSTIVVLVAITFAAKWIYYYNQMVYDAYVLELSNKGIIDYYKLNRQ